MTFQVILETERFGTVLRRWQAGANSPLAYEPYGSAYLRTSVGAKIGFCGQMYSSELDGYFLGNGYRVYYPRLRRYGSRDSYSPFRVLNAYAYCDGDPVNHFDPTGHFSWRRIAYPGYGSIKDSVTRLGARAQGMKGLLDKGYFNKGRPDNFWDKFDLEFNKDYQELLGLSDKESSRAFQVYDKRHSAEKALGTVFEVFPVFANDVFPLRDYDRRVNKANRAIRNEMRDVRSEINAIERTQVKGYGKFSDLHSPAEVAKKDASVELANRESDAKIKKLRNHYWNLEDGIIKTRKAT